MSSASKYENQKAFLDNALKHRKFSHAYLFCGPEQETKKKIAEEFANKILGSEKGKINPDLIVIDQEKLKIEDIRTLISELSLKPYQYEYKVAIIQGFEGATDEGANSILKTLEEPNPSTIIILLAKNKLSLLPTIVSRCQTIYFNGNDDATGKDVLGELSQQSEAGKLVAVKEYAEQETAELQVTLESWLAIERKKMLSGSPEKFSNLRNLLEALDGLKKNLNKKLILEKLFLNLTK